MTRTERILQNVSNSGQMKIAPREIIPSLLVILNIIFLRFVENNLSRQRAYHLEN